MYTGPGTNEGHIVNTAPVISPVEFLWQVRPDGAIVQNSHATSSSDNQLAEKLCNDL